MLKMNLLYAAYIREDSSGKGFLNKTISQCSAFKAKIENVYMYISRKDESVLYKIEKNKIEEIKVYRYKDFYVYSKQRAFRKVKGYLRYNSFVGFLSEIIDSFGIDVLYYRNSYPTKKLLDLIKHKSCLKVIEIVTYPYKAEWRKIMPTYEYLFWTFGQKKINKISDIIVAISSDNTLKVDKKFVLINNGIRLEDIKIKNQNKKSYINLLSIAYVDFRHGYDRIIKGLHKYYKKNPKKQVYYHCVGEGPVLENLKNLVKELKLEKYVIFHGTKVGEELDKIVDDSDVAFGSLGFHRIYLKGGSPLKAREYCARGIPFVIAYDDWDFPESFPYVFRIPQDDSPVDIDKVINWYEDLSKKHPDYSLEMRKYAEENLSWDAKMRPVIEKIKDLANERNINT